MGFGFMHVEGLNCCKTFLADLIIELEQCRFDYLITWIFGCGEDVKV